MGMNNQRQENFVLGLLLKLGERETLFLPGFLRGGDISSVASNHLATMRKESLRDQHSEKQREAPRESKTKPHDVA